MHGKMAPSLCDAVPLVARRVACRLLGCGLPCGLLRGLGLLPLYVLAALLAVRLLGPSARLAGLRVGLLRGLSRLGLLPLPRLLRLLPLPRLLAVVWRLLAPRLLLRVLPALLAVGLLLGLCGGLVLLAALGLLLVLRLWLLVLRLLALGAVCCAYRASSLGFGWS